MSNIKKAMKYSIIFGSIGAFLMPVLYEFYANISKSISLILMLVYVVVASIFFSKLDRRSSFLGITVSIVYSCSLAMVCYVVIHPLVEKILSESSVYFQLSLKEQVKFFGYSILLLVGMYLICLTKKGIMKAFYTFKSNREKAGSYIEDAFSDEENLK